MYLQVEWTRGIDCRIKHEVWRGSLILSLSEWSINRRPNEPCLEPESKWDNAHPRHEFISTPVISETFHFHIEGTPRLLCLHAQESTTHPSVWCGLTGCSMMNVTLYLLSLQPRWTWTDEWIVISEVSCHEVFSDFPVFPFILQTVSS